MAYAFVYSSGKNEIVDIFTYADADAAAYAAYAAAADAAYADAAYAAAYAADAADAAAYAAAAAAAASAATSEINSELSTEFYLAEIAAIKSEIKRPLWPKDAPAEWQELAERYLSALSERGLDYWAEEYSGWLRGEFNRERLLNCAQMPDSIAKGSVAAQLQYLSAVQRAYFGETRVLYLGEASAGKTSLIRCLHGEAINEHEVATPRVEIRSRQLSNSDGERLRVHDWDFGGQVLMHAMHQFFLSENVVYVVVADMRREESLEYWLEYARVFGKGAATLVLLNKVDLLEHREQTPFKFDPEVLKQRYPFIVDFVKISCAKDVNLDYVRQAIDQLCWRQQVLSGTTPKSWFQVKELVQAENKDHISFERFRELCSQCDLLPADAIGAASEAIIAPTIDALTQLGAALYYREIGAKVVLNPEWMTRAIYYAINAAEAAGIEYLTPETIADLYAQGYQKGELDLSIDKSDAEFLLQLMQKFELAFTESDNPSNYYLPMVAPVAVPKAGKEFGHGSYFRFQLDFLPPALFYRFITLCGAEVIPGRLWRTGAQLLSAGMVVQVEYQKREQCILLRTRLEGNGDYVEKLRARLYKLMGDSYQDIEYRVEYYRSDGHVFLWKQVLAYLGRGSELVPDINGNEVPWLADDLRRSFARSNQQAESMGREFQVVQSVQRPASGDVNIYLKAEGGKADAQGGSAEANAKSESDADATATASAEVNIEVQLDRFGAELKELVRELERAQQDDGETIDQQQYQRVLREMNNMREDLREAKETKPGAGLQRNLQSGWDNLQKAAKGLENVERIGSALGKIGAQMAQIPWSNIPGLS